MNNAEEFAKVAGLIAEPSRAIMLWSLLDGRAYTAGELAISADISPQAASNHLAKLINHSLLDIEKQGRHRFYRLARPEVAYALEAMAHLMPESVRLKNQSNEAHIDGVKYARTCYDHLAGKLGVQLTAALVVDKLLIPQNKQYILTDKGKVWFNTIGVDVDKLASRKRGLALQCLDWSERKPHLAGALGAALLQSLLSREWIRKKKASREVILTHSGQENLAALLGKLTSQNVV